MGSVLTRTSRLPTAQRISPAPTTGPIAPRLTGSGRQPSSGGNSTGFYFLAPAPSAPRSQAPAATLVGGLRLGSLRVHAPCKKGRHGSRLGFPGRRSPGGPARPAHVARGP